jgi:ArsR family metal-binding transcriptional regulator
MFGSFFGHREECEVERNDDQLFIRQVTNCIEHMPYKMRMTIGVYLELKIASKRFIDNETSRRKFRKIRRKATRNLKKRNVLTGENTDAKLVANEIYRIAYLHKTKHKKQFEKDCVVAILHNES